MRIALVSDAWLPQVNGVVRTLSALRRELESSGHEVAMVTPDRFTTIPCPTYPEIRLAMAPRWRLERILAAAMPDTLHIATEGPLGLAARSWCRRNGFRFSTSFHTKFPEYVSARFGVPERWTYGLLRRFHQAAQTTMVATPTLQAELEARGFSHLSRWTRGVDLSQFRPVEKSSSGFPRPIYLSVGRVAVEKNLPAFLDLDLPGTKLVVGDGPARAELAARYPQVHFLGVKVGAELARLYAEADVFVFPSRTDTFGLVLLEALASGVPVAAFPVPGPLDVIDGSGAGILDWDLRRAALSALEIPADRCRSRAQAFTWAASARQFIANLQRVR
jgi:glycosyltransferase involved in cell wall biosynthesis